jgi:hypothetical protein
MKKHRQEPNQKQELYGGANEKPAKIKASHKQQNFSFHQKLRDDSGKREVMLRANALL